MSDAVTIAAGPLAVRFYRRGDRFAHEILAVGAGGETVLLRSLEDDAGELWPASPPFQQFHREDRGPESRVALLVGQAGSTHWSCSGTADSRRGTLEFDVAARVRAAQDRLGSRYQLAEGVSPAPAEETGVIRLATSAGRIDVTSASKLQIELANLAIAPHDRLSEFPHTIRWQYALSAQ